MKKQLNIKKLILLNLPYTGGKEENLRRVPALP